MKSESEVAQSCPTLSDTMDCSPSGSSVHGIFQARVLEWSAIAHVKEATKDSFHEVWKVRKQPYSFYVWKVSLEAPAVVACERDCLSSGSFLPAGCASQPAAPSVPFRSSCSFSDHVRI